MQNKSQNYKDVFEKSNIINNKANSSNMSSAKNNSLAKIGGKAKSWHDGLRSESGWQRVQTIGDIVATAMGMG